MDQLAQAIEAERILNNPAFRAAVLEACRSDISNQKEGALAHAIRRIIRAEVEAVMADRG